MSLVELRILDGPNADLPVPAVRLTVTRPRPGGPDPAGVVDRIARAAGVYVGPALTRPGPDGTLVVVFPWAYEGIAEAVGQGAAEVLAADDDVAQEALIARVADAVRTAPVGGPPRAIDPAVPTVAVTGTNGKTTTTRLLARMAREAGLVTAWSSTDGVYVDGVCVDAGDWSGPGGARQVLQTPEVGFAVLETARGGLMLRGMGVTAVDVAVFTNVSADHLGLQGLDTVEQLAWAKSTVVKVVRPGGWAVLNAEDPLVRQYHDAGPGRPWFFSLDPAGEAAGFAQQVGGPLSTMRSGRLVVLGWRPEEVDLGDVREIPVTIAGLSWENVANALAAASAGLAAGLPVEAVRAGLRSFTADAAASPGRMNLWTVPTGDGGAATVILDFAHNEAGTAALLRVGLGLRAPGAKLHVSIGNAGDRTDEGIAEVARMAGASADTVQLAAKSHYLRGRTQQEMDELQRAGLRAVGVEAVEEVPDEPTGLRALLARARDGDVLAMMIHQDRDACVALLDEAGATPDDPTTIAAKATAAAVPRGG